MVGTGTAASCTETALAAAVSTGGVITFDCGGPATISITSTLVLNKSKATTLDGGGKVTLDGGGKVRILSFNGGGYRTTSTVITLQNLTFQNGHATGTKLTVYPAPLLAGIRHRRRRRAVYVVDGVLRVIDCTFTGNSGQTPGPDVAGGAVYVNGSKGTTIIGSRFADNTASNGGAVGSLNSDLAVYTSTMSGNTATGTGPQQHLLDVHQPEHRDRRRREAAAPSTWTEGPTARPRCAASSCRITTPTGFGGAIFRVFDNATHDFDIDVSTLDSNVADGPVGTDGDGPGAGAFYVHNANVNVNNSTISNNSSPGCGALQADATTVTFSNVTFSGNKATDGIGGAMCLFSNGGTLTNCTFAGNQALGGSSYSNYYGAAIFGGGLTLNNCVLANNTTANTMGRMQCAGGAPETGSNDVQWPMNKVAGGGADTPCVPGITFADPMPGSLQNNGGPTDTVTLGAAASVVQIGTGCPATDQTGKTRATPCTIGALEEMIRRAGATRVQPIEGSGHLVLRETGDLVEIMAANVVLLSSAALATELAFGALAATLTTAVPRRVIVGGLGFGATVRGVLDVVPARTRVTVVEKVPAIPPLVRGPLAHFADRALEDPRVEVVVGDVGEVVAAEKGSADVILMDVDNGPHWASFRTNARLYSPAGLACFREALRRGGAVAFWSGYRADAFAQTLRAAALEASIVPLQERGRVRARAYVGRLR